NPSSTTAIHPVYFTRGPLSTAIRACVTERTSFSFGYREKDKSARMTRARGKERRKAERNDCAARGLAPSRVQQTKCPPLTCEQRCERFKQMAVDVLSRAEVVDQAHDAGHVQHAEGVGQFAALPGTQPVTQLAELFGAAVPGAIARLHAVAL